MRSLKLAIAVIIPFLLIQLSLRAQEQKETDFKKTCTALLETLSKKNYSGLNKLINKTYGMCQLYRTGAMDRYSNYKKIDDSTLMYMDSHEITAKDIKKFILQYGKLPVYDCDKNSWSRRGYCTDSVKRFSPVTTIVNFEIKYEQFKITKKEKSDIRFIEQNSRKVIFTSSKGDGLIFYLCYISGKWYVSILDMVTTDCSA